MMEDRDYWSEERGVCIMIMTSRVALAVWIDEPGR
jgi:hypothetical protein